MRQESNRDTAVEVQSGRPEEQDRSRICNSLNSIITNIFFVWEIGGKGKRYFHNYFFIKRKRGIERLFEEDRSKIF